MQRYGILCGHSGDSRGCRAIAGHFLWLPEIIHDSFHLLWRKGFTYRLIAHGLEFGPEAFALAYPGHEVVDGGAGLAIWEVH